MKKIFQALLVFSAVLYMMPVFACSQKYMGNITGGACSIKDLYNLEKPEQKQEKVQFLQQGEINLRPVRLYPEFRKGEDRDCLFGVCTLKKLLKK